MALVDGVRGLVARALLGGKVTQLPVWYQADTNQPWLATAQQAPNADYYRTVATVYACVKLRADNIAKPRLVVYRGDPEGDNDRVEATHPFQALLDKVNPWYTRGQLWRYTETALCLWGNAYWLLLPDSRGQLAEIWPLQPPKVRALPGKGGDFISGFELHVGQEKLPIPPAQMLWLRYHNPYDDYCGLSPLAAAQMPAAINREALSWNHRFFQNGAEPGRVYIKSDQPLTRDQVDDLESQWARKFRGYANSHRVPIFGQGSELKTLALSQRDMEFLATQRYTKEEICSIYGVPPPLIGDLERATYANITEARKSLWHETLIPEMHFIRDEVNESLAPRFGVGIYTDSDLSQVAALQEDANSRSARDVNEIKVGLRTINEVRSERNLEPVLWGDEPPAVPVPTFGEPGPPLKQIRTVVVERPALELAPVRKDITYTAQQARLMDAHLKRLDPAERRMASWLREEFAREERDVLARLRGRKALVTKQTIEELYTADEVAEALAKGGKPLLQAALEAAGKAGAAELGISFDVTNPRVVLWLGERTRLFGRQVSATTADAIAAQLREAYAAGEGIDAIAARIEGVFQEANEVRATMIARTEMVGSSNRGALESYQQAGVSRKEWLSAGDERVRPTHEALHGKIIPLDADFEVGTDRMQAPGQGSDPGEVVNCRCSVAPVLDAKAATYCPSCRRFLGKGLSGQVHCPKCSKLVPVG